jgi:hypothetical protein
MRHSRHAVPHVGNDVDDRGVAGCLHVLRVALACDEKPTREVVAHDRVPAFGRDVLEARRELSARVVDERIDPAEIGEDRGDGLAYAIFLANVAGIALRLAADMRNLV